jgi:hypothetical protein
LLNRFNQPQKDSKQQAVKKVKGSRLSRNPAAFVFLELSAYCPSLTIQPSASWTTRLP